MRALAATVVMVLIVSLAAACSGNETEAAGGPKVTREQSEEVARELVKSDETYRFDGIDGTLELVSTEDLDCAGCWAFVYRFESAYAGYGDRSDQVVAQVITPHEARVVVEQGTVTGGVLDGRWDMMNEEPVP